MNSDQIMGGETVMVNLTPHAINLAGVVIPPDSQGPARRAVETYTLEGRVMDLYGPITGLPEPQENTIYVVSALVRQAAPDRFDLASPGGQLRDSEGRVIGCTHLVYNGTSDGVSIEPQYPDGLGYKVVLKPWGAPLACTALSLDPQRGEVKVSLISPVGSVAMGFRPLDNPQPSCQEVAEAWATVADKVLDWYRNQR